ncbi:MAG TPA: hypothetical protein VM936_10295 [Pyrinomonadaceae bacterium]|jgi:hypothetical protein|nr:hypothetical protein [Pyrinomonadaceae bacterium]
MLRVMWKRLSSAIRSILPNVAWDVIKKAWRWFKASPYYPPVVVGTLTMVGTYAVAVLERLRGMTPDLQGVLIIALVLFFVLSVVFLFARLKARRGDATLTTAKGLSSQETTSDADRWLRELAERDKREIDKYVVAREPSIDYSGLDATVPYFVITFKVANYSVHPISIDAQDVKGAIYRNDEEISGNLKIVSHIGNLSRGDEPMTLALKQWVSPEEVTLIVNPMLDTVLKFDRLRITIKAGDDALKIQPKLLRLPSGIPIKETQPPNLRVNELKDRIGALEREKAALEQRVEGLDTQWKGHLFSHRWMFDLIQRQSNAILSYVELVRCTKGEFNLSGPMYSVTFGLYIVNHSIFDITVEVEQGKGVLFGDYRLDTYPMKVLYNDLRDAPCGKKGVVTIEQPLTKEEAEYISSRADTADTKFYLDGLVVTVKGSKFNEAQLKIDKPVNRDGVNFRR